MGMFDYFKKEKNISEEYSPFFVLNEAEAKIKATNIFKGEVEQDKKKFPVELGDEHPFDFSVCEGLYKKMGFITAVVDKFVDFIVGPGFFIECDDERAKKIIEDFMKDVNFDTLLRAWIKEALIKGNGFLEIGGKKDEVSGLKVLNGNYMYIDRDEKGNITGYNQYTGGFKRFDKSKVIPFEKWEVAHIPFNKIGDNPYGIGIVYPALTTVNNLLQNEKDLQTLINRKANVPYTVRMGAIVGDKYYKPKKEDIDAMGQKLEWLHNKHEWVHDGLTEIKALDFGNIGDKFSFVLEHNIQMLFYTFQIPAVLMGEAKVPEGLAKVQMDAFERRVNSIQAEVEKVIEKDLFKRILNANGFNVHVEFEWGRPSNTERYERLGKLTELMKIPMVSGSLVKLMEKDIVNMLNYDEKEFESMSKEEEREREEERPQPIVPGQNEEPPQPQEHVCPHCSDIEEGQYNKIEEWLGFNYKKYLSSILDVVKNEKFEYLTAKNKVEEVAGLLSVEQIDKLKSILDKGFKNGRSIRDISLEIDKKVGLKDLLKMENGKIVTGTDGMPIVVKYKDVRPLAIARTEITRVGNKGAVEYFKKEGENKVRWVASWGSRTCPICEALNGNVYDINNIPDLPQHTMCRCTVVPLSEVK